MFKKLNVCSWCKTKTENKPAYAGKTIWCDACDESVEEENDD